MNSHAGVFAILAFVYGALIGSFLNACIHRLPRDLSLSQPRRSFCPHCHATIAWYHNIPILSWLWLRGRCAKCGASISSRYLLVEILTAFVFLALWLKFGLPLAPVYALFAALLIAATFIDFEHYIIPDEITIGGAIAGVALSAIFPAMMNATTHWQSLRWSLTAAIIGGGILWLVVEGGKLAFGRKRLVPEQPEPFRFEADEENPRLVIGDETWPWQEIFSRESDALILECEHGTLNGGPFRDEKVRVYHDRVVVGKTATSLAGVRQFTGVVRAVVVPREAMGFGDVKFIACIGAFLGWQAVLFTVAVSSIFGAMIGIGTLLVTRGQAGGKIPYGPYLALGAALWLACGPDLVQWYLALLQPPRP